MVRNEKSNRIKGEIMKPANIDFFGNKKWMEISREERMFCAYLYFDILDKGIKNFIEQINKLPSTVKSFNNSLELDTSEDWDIGYEVCFYRDLLFSNKLAIKEVNAERLKKGEIEFPIKRTFDLCLFSKDEIIIIEAKAQGKLEDKQCENFNKDKENIKALFDLLKINKEISIKIIILASSFYLTSPSFSLPKGTGKKFIKESKESLLGFISWEQIQEIFKENQIYAIADDAYKRGKEN
jgi:hypothetical protein